MEVDSGAGAPASANPPDTATRVVLHPLPLMSISDYIVRHTLRQRPGPVVGALFGQQNGHEMTIEIAFELKTLSTSEQVSLDKEWFEIRTAQFTEVHKARNLVLVGWYTLSPAEGPTPQTQLITDFIANAIAGPTGLLLCFHPSVILEPNNQTRGKLPVTIYQYDSTRSNTANGNNSHSPNTTRQLLEVEYTIDTDEAEMISLAYVASGAANATTHANRVDPHKLKQKNDTTTDETHMSKADEELIAAITNKADAIKMLRSRIDVLVKFLQQLNDKDAQQYNTILRSIQALVHQLKLIVPSDTKEFQHEMASEKNDVATITLLNDLMQSVMDTREVSRISGVVEGAKAAKSYGDYMKKQDAQGTRKSNKAKSRGHEQGD